MDNCLGSTESRYLEYKNYELKDHLGNVRVVVSDMKNPTTYANLNKGAPFSANVISVFNYYAFGMLMPGLYSTNATNYRFGFNGMLGDDDVKELIFIHLNIFIVLAFMI